ERARRALHADARRLSYALEGANDGLWDWDLPSGQGFFSQRAARMFGYGPEEFRTASRWDLLIHEDDRGPAKAAFEAHARGETPFYEAEVRCRHKDGSWIWIHDRGKIVERAADGTAIRAVGTYTDISERKRLESALEHLANHDALTQLANRAVFERELDRAAARMERHGGRVAVLLIDVDHFKSVNDTFGHAAGDALL
ncbi:PAS domain-containing protein, partial [Hansschlegelia beijingensis]